MYLQVDCYPWISTAGYCCWMAPSKRVFLKWPIPFVTLVPADWPLIRDKIDLHHTNHRCGLNQFGAFRRAPLSNRIVPLRLFVELLNEKEKENNLSLILIFIVIVIKLR